MPEFEFTYYAWVALLIAGASIAWLLNFFALPGNWIIVGLAALFAWAIPATPGGPGIDWQAVALLGVIAFAGELLETVAGAFGAAKQGASRRAMALAVVGTMAGSIAGALGGLPLPVAGPILGALIGGGVGAFAGAWLGEMWKHGLADRSINVGWAALIGRLLGTVGKLAIGAVLVVATAIHAIS